MWAAAAAVWAAVASAAAAQAGAEAPATAPVAWSAWDRIPVLSRTWRIPLNPVVLTSPPNQTGSIDIRTFSPTFASRTGADVFQLEISTDRTFKNPSRIYRQQIISTSPNSDGAIQGVPTPIDLTTLPELIADPTFAAFVSAWSTTNPPAVYWRVGARHDEDQPGPINWISQNPSDPDKTFRFIYSQIFSFTPAPVPPPASGPAGSNTKRDLQR